MKGRGSDGRLEAEMAAFLLWHASACDIPAQSIWLQSSALSGLSTLLGSGNGMASESAAGAFANIGYGSDLLKQTVVGAGPLGGLVALLRSRNGEEAEYAARALANTTSGPAVLKQAVVDAGGLTPLRHLSGMSHRRASRIAMSALVVLQC